MRNKKGCILSVLLVLFIFGVSIPLFMTNHKKVKADTINDLTNTNWLFNQTLTINSIGTYTGNNLTFNLNYTCDNSTYNVVTFGSTNGTRYNAFTIGTHNYLGGWTNGAPSVVTFTGGTDITNSTFITWLQNNATQQAPTPTGTEITHKYWSLYHFAVMEDNQVIRDDDIEYKVIYNQYHNNTFEDTEQIGLIFKGMNTTDNEQHSYIESLHPTIDAIYILYMGDTNYIYNACLYEFNVGDYMDTELYDFLTECGVWFDDDELDIYIVGVDEGIVRGEILGRAQGQADGTQYTTLISNIFNGIGDLLSIQVFPNITIGLLIGLPLLLGVLVIILKILRG